MRDVTVNQQHLRFANALKLPAREMDFTLPAADESLREIHASGVKFTHLLSIKSMSGPVFAARNEVASAMLVNGAIDHHLAKPRP